MLKVSILGAGAVGATTAEYIAMKNFVSEVVLLDIIDGLAEGKAMDLSQTASMNRFETKIIGTTGDYSKTAGSQVVVLTSGVPRKPGMSREDLVGVNAEIVKNVIPSILQYSPNAIIIVVVNPMDTMTYLVQKISGLPRNRVIGMGGELDSARFKYQLSEALGCPATEIDGMVIAAHTDTGMVPLLSKATYKGVPVCEFLSEDKIDYVVEETKIGGATLTKLLGISSWYAPGAATAVLVHSILCDHEKMMPCSVMLEGEYGQHDVCIGVPVIIGKNGLERIVEIKLTDAEKDKFNASVAAVKEVNAALKNFL
ncbi:MAG: malate dehydrogenase [Paludibacter sp.]|nr:malate dehydrogenase [Paludibacter sp.]